MRQHVCRVIVDGQCVPKICVVSAAAYRDHAVRLWNTTAGGAPLVLRGHEGFVHGLTFRPDGACLLSWADDRTLREWQVPTGQLRAVSQVVLNSAGQSGGIHTGDRS